MAYNVTENYKQVIYSQDTRNKIKILFNNVELQEVDRYCERATIKSRIIPNGAKRFSLNNFISKEVEIILHDIDTSIIQDQVSISIGTLVGNAYEYVPIGIFNIQGTPTTDKNKITIKLRDNSIKFDFNYNAKPLIDNNGGTATKLQILQDICTKAGVTCNISSFIGSTDNVGIYDNTITARQYVAYLAEQAGKIATINRSGELIFVDINNLSTWNIPLSLVEKYEIGKSYKIGQVIYEDGIVKYETSSSAYDILYLDASNPYVSSQSQVNSILTQVNTFEIDSVKTGKILGNPAIDGYDLINIYDDKTQGNPSVFKTLATSELIYNGKLLNTFDNQIGEEAREQNTTILGEPTFKKWAKTEINNINGEILIQAGKIDNVEKEINPTDTATGSSIYLEDSGEAPLINFELEGKTTQATRSGKNLFNKDVTFSTNGASSIVLDTGIRVTSTVTGNYRRVFTKIGGSELLGKTITVSSTMTVSASNIPSIRLFFGSSSNSAIQSIGGLTSTGFSTMTIPSSFPTNATGIYVSLYSNTTGTGNIDDYVDYTNLQIEFGSTATDYEPYGQMPSPDYPSELVSVGYENLINKEQIILGYFRISDGTYLASTSTTYKSTELIPVSPNTKYYSNVVAFSSSAVGVTYWDDSGTFISGSALSSNHIYTTPSNAKYMRLSFKYVDSDITNVDTLYLIKGTQAHSYIPYGKYGIEVKTTGKNIFDGVLEQGSVNSQGINSSSTTRLRTKNYISVYPNTTYALKVNENTTGKNLQFSISYYDKNDYTTYRLSYLNWTTSNPITFTTPSNCKYIRFLIAYTDNANITISDGIGDIQLEKGTQATTYEEYKSNTYLYTLNQPLRSIGDTKDLLYIKNGMLYVERKIGSKILDGSETWNSQTGTHTKVFNLYTSMSGWNAVQSKTEVKCEIATYSVSAGANNDTITNICAPNNTGANFLLDLSQEDFTSTNAFETWLSTHNTEVQYILASSNIEGVGKIEVPSTYKTITHIDTTDELQPNMNITYVMNTQITNYVQNQVNQIKITEDGILAEVNRKVDNEEIIAKLNLAIEDEQGIIEITGNQVTIDSDYFELNANGTIKSTGGTIGGYKITDNMLYAETFAKYNYTENDLDKIRNYLMGTGTLTPEEFIKYDVNESGTVTSLDYVIIKFFIEYNVTPTSSAKIIMKTGNSISDNAYILQDGAGNEIFNIGFNGIYYKDINLANTTTYSENELVVGKWIDNKPIYRKVIDIGNLPNASQTIVSHNISNIERIVKLYGSATRDSDKETMPIPYVTFNSNNSGGINLYANNVSVLVSTSSDRSSYTGYVVLEYTKTSD